MVAGVRVSQIWLTIPRKTRRKWLCDRYLELLAKAENVEAAPKVEKDLERLNGEIELLKGKIGKIEHLADYSTIEVNITQKHKLGVLGDVFVGFYKGVKWLFVRD